MNIPAMRVVAPGNMKLSASQAASTIQFVSGELQPLPVHGMGVGVQQDNNPVLRTLDTCFGRLSMRVAGQPPLAFDEEPDIRLFAKPFPASIAAAAVDDDNLVGAVSNKLPHLLHQEPDIKKTVEIDGNDADRPKHNGAQTKRVPASSAITESSPLLPVSKPLLHGVLPTNHNVRHEFGTGMLSFEERKGDTQDNQGDCSETDLPSVSILVPVHNRLDLTKACLESVFETAEKSVPFEIIVIDDKSVDGTVEYLQSLGARVRTIRNSTRKCFAENVNSAVPLAKGEYLCLLNNDTLVTAGWLQKLLAAARSDPAIAVVGNRHLSPGTNLIDHAGMVFDSRKRPVHLYRGQPADFRPAQFSQEFQCVTAACWLVRKNIFLELGGFDAEFKNGCEDIDFCLRAGRAGHKIFYAADSVIYHYGQSTPGRKDHETSNSRYFEKKWGDSIASDLHHYYVLPPPAYDAHWSERFARLEDLEHRRPLAASLIKTVIRAATSLARRL